MTQVTFTVEIEDEGPALLKVAADIWNAIESVEGGPKVVGNSLTNPTPFLHTSGHTGNCRCITPTTIHSAKRGEQQERSGKEFNP